MTNTPDSETKISTATEVAEKLEQAGFGVETPPDTARLIVRTTRWIFAGSLMVRPALEIYSRWTRRQARGGKAWPQS